MSRVVAVAAAVLAIAIGLADRFAEPVAVPFGQDPGPLLPLLDVLRINTRYELFAVVLIAGLVAFWRRDVVVLVATAGLLAFLWWDHPSGPVQYALLGREQFEAMRVHNPNGFIAGGVLLAAAAISGRRASPA